MDKKQAALTFLTSHSVGVLGTLSPAGTPRSRTVYYSSDDAFSVYFLTLTGTRKVDDLTNNAHASFVISAEGAPQTLQIEGMVSDLTETATINPAIASLVAKMQEHGAFFAPLTHLDPGTVRFYRLAPTWVRWGDFTNGFGGDASFTEIVP